MMRDAKDGIVFIARCEPEGYWPRESDGAEYVGHWEREDPTPRIAEEGPGWDNVEAAIAWGRERAPRVLVNLTGSSDGVYSAGERRSVGKPEWPPPGWPDATP